MVDGDAEGDDTVDHADWLRWKETTVDGRIAVYGEAGRGIPALFLHGWGLDHKAYKRSLSRLVRARAARLRTRPPWLRGDRRASRGGRHHGRLRRLGGGLPRVGAREGAPLVIGHSFGGGVAIALAHGHRRQVRGLVLINSIGGSAWFQTSLIRSLVRRPPWDWGIHLEADLLPLREARRVVPVIVSEALPNLVRDPRSFWRAAALASRADLTAELENLRRRHLPVVVLWGARDQLLTRRSLEALCRALGDPDVVTVAGAHSWLLADPDAFAEVMTNVLDVVGLLGPAADVV